MTREEAKRILNRVLEEWVMNDDVSIPREEALRFVIKALEQEPSGDAISRQAVFDINESHHGQMPNHINHQIWQEIKELSPVNPQEPKTGHWITQWNVAHQKEYYYCSECREEFSYDGETGIKMNDYKYCPNCGARMESEE